jgi:hypothetical protein
MSCTVERVLVPHVVVVVIRLLVKYCQVLSCTVASVVELS